MKFASIQVEEPDAVEQPIQKSYRTIHALVTALLIFVLGLYFFYLTQAYYFSIDADSYIVLRVGAPQFTFLPGFGRVAIQTDFKKEDLADDKCRDLDRGKLSGFWFLHSKEGYQRWGDQLADCLKPAIREEWLRLLKGFTYSAGMLLRSVVSSENSIVASSGESDLEQLAHIKPEFFTPDIIQSLTVLLTDKNANVRSSAASILHQLAGANPKVFTPNIIQSLTTLLVNQDYLIHSQQTVLILGSLAKTKPDVSRSLAALLAEKDRDIRYRVTFALTQLAKDDPASFPAEMIPSLLALLSDRESNVRSMAVSTLGQIAYARPDLFTSRTVQSITALLADKEYHVRASAASALGGIAQTRPEFFTPEIIQPLAALLADRESFVRSSTALALGKLAVTRPEYFTAETVQTLMVLLTDSGSFVPCSAAFALSRFAQTQPGWFTSAMIQALTARLADEDLGVRSNVTVALEELVQRNPGAFTSGVVEELLTLLRNEDPQLRSDAASILGALAEKKPEIIASLFLLLKNEKASNGRIGAAEALFVADVKDIRQKDFIEDELEELIKSPQPYLRAAASQALEMIAIGNLVQEAHAHPDQLPIIKTRLNELMVFDESRHEEHLQFAAGFALGEIENIKSENK